MVKPGTFCGIKSRRVKIAFIVRVLFVLSLASISILNAFFGPSNGESVASIKSRPKRHLLQILQDQVEVFEPIVVEPENYTEFPPETTEASVLRGRNCTPAAIFEFPSDGFTREERKHGWITVHLLIACYCFWLLAIVCDDYFVPAIELMCKKLQVKEDIAGATFMAAASSSPELFINCVGTFVTKGDIGVGAVVGSAVFNILAVPAVCGLFGGQVVQLRWWPVTRDSMMYGMAVIGLITVLNDGKVMWYEAIILVSAYILYITEENWSRFKLFHVFASLQEMSQLYTKKCLAWSFIQQSSSEIPSPGQCIVTISLLDGGHSIRVARQIPGAWYRYQPNMHFVQILSQARTCAVDSLLIYYFGMSSYFTL